jgi:hypothetical protein
MSGLEDMGSLGRRPFFGDACFLRGEGTVGRVHWRRRRGFIRNLIRKR